MKNKNTEQDRLISVLVHRQPGVMDRLTGLLRRRGFITEGISAGRTKESELLRLTVHVRGDDRCIEQVQKQLGKITETVKVAAIDPHRHVRREVALVKIRCAERERDSLLRLTAEFQGRIVDAAVCGIIVELTGDPQSIDRFIGRLDADAIVEIARSGIVAMDDACRSTKSGAKVKSQSSQS